MRFPGGFAVVATFAAGISTAFGQEPPAGPPITETEWAAYSEAFLQPDGRIVDDANGGVSHSEGQGYGMLLAYLADARGDFETIWTFANTQLRLRDDRLIAWRWDPEASPNVTDINNATDGDILIAYALGMAGRTWERPDFSEAGEILAEAIAEHAIVDAGQLTVILPGADGFSAEAREDGPVVNPSYWVFEAFGELESLYPEGPWQAVYDSGIALVEEGRFGPHDLPAEWLSLSRGLAPAEDLPTAFGYNALRVPLYLVRAGYRDREVLERMRDGMTDEAGNVRLIGFGDDGSVETLTDPGYLAIPALIDCALDGTALPEKVADFTPTNYYPSTLHLLVLSYVREELPQCL